MVAATPSWSAQDVASEAQIALRRWLTLQAGRTTPDTHARCE